MTGMTTQDLRDCTQCDPLYETLRLEMGNGLVVQYGNWHKVAIEASCAPVDGAPDLYYLARLGNDDELNKFFAAMGGIVNVLGIVE